MVSEPPVGDLAILAFFHPPDRLRVEFDFNSSANCGNAGLAGASLKASLLVNYVYLDSEERKRFVALTTGKYY